MTSIGQLPLNILARDITWKYSIVCALIYRVHKSHLVSSGQSQFSISSFAMYVIEFSVNNSLIDTASMLSPLSLVEVKQQPGKRPLFSCNSHLASRSQHWKEQVRGTGPSMSCRRTLTCRRYHEEQHFNLEEKNWSTADMRLGYSDLQSEACGGITSHT